MLKEDNGHWGYLISVIVLFLDQSLFSTYSFGIGYLVAATGFSGRTAGYPNEAETFPKP